jgi:RNA polymerase sigma-70 factor (ECF subfamily)
LGKFSGKKRNFTAWLPTPCDLEIAMTDLQLWTAFKNGDKEALGNLFKRYYPLLFQYGIKLCNKKTLLEDCIQELFIELWQNKSGNEIISVKAYLLKAVRYKVFKALKGKTAMESTDTISDEMNFEISHENFLITEQENLEKAKKILEAVNSLPTRQKEIIYLRVYQNLDYENICEIMGVNYQVARNLFYQAIQSLRKLVPLFVLVVPDIITKL